MRATATKQSKAYKSVFCYCFHFDLQQTAVVEVVTFNWHLAHFITCVTFFCLFYFVFVFVCFFICTYTLTHSLSFSNNVQGKCACACACAHPPFTTHTVHPQAPEWPSARWLPVHPVAWTPTWALFPLSLTTLLQSPRCSAAAPPHAPQHA